MNKKCLSIKIVTLGILASIFIFILYTHFLRKETIVTLMGNFSISKGIISEAIENKAMQRMKLVDQGGPVVYFERAPHFARYDHCLGVWGLLKRFGASEEEQLVGLWHDISHTAFSHVADIIFKESDHKHSYQDKIHLWYLSNSDAKELISKHNLNINDLDPESGKYLMLEQDLPDMCADRIEYNLHTGFIYNILTKEQINNIIEHLHFDFIKYEDNNQIFKEKKWYFDNITSAKQFALLPIYFMKTVWNAPYSVTLYKTFSQLIQYAFEKNYLSTDMFHFGTDKDILKILETSEDKKIKDFLKQLHHIEQTFSVLNSDEKNYDAIFNSKFRGIDPLVKEKEKNIAKRLTNLDQNFKYLYETTKNETEKSIKIKYHSI